VKIGAWSFFERGHKNGEPDHRYLIAALHWPWSITWRWLLDWTPWMNVFGSKPLYWWFGNRCGAIGARLPLLGQFHFAWQANMPWKRPCTCHPDDNPPRPCPQKFALTECRKAHVSSTRTAKESTKEKS